MYIFLIIFLIIILHHHLYIIDLSTFIVDKTLYRGPNYQIYQALFRRWYGL